jgi:hypothetical protein
MTTVIFEKPALSSKSERKIFHRTSFSGRIIFMYNGAPVSTDSVLVVYRDPKKKLKFKEIKGS